MTVSVLCLICTCAGRERLKKVDKASPCIGCLSWPNGPWLDRSFANDRPWSRQAIPHFMPSMYHSNVTLHRIEMRDGSYSVTHTMPYRSYIFEFIIIYDSRFRSKISHHGRGWWTSRLLWLPLEDVRESWTTFHLNIKSNKQKLSMLLLCKLYWLYLMDCIIYFSYNLQLLIKKNIIHRKLLKGFMFLLWTLSGAADK